MKQKTSGIAWLVGTPLSRALSVFVYLVLSIGLIVYWQWHVVMTAHTPKGAQFVYLYSSPQLVSQYVLHHVRYLAAMSWLSIKHVLVALVIGSVVGFPLGVVLGLTRRLWMLVILVFGTVIPFPKLAILIFMTAWFGQQDWLLYVYNIWVVFILCALLGFLGTNNLLTSTDAAAPDLLHAAVMYYQSRWQMLWGWVLPALTDQWLHAMMLCSAILWPLLIFSEPNVNPNDGGLGSLMYAAGVLDLRMEVAISATVLLTIGNMSTWFLLWKLQRSWQRYIRHQMFSLA